MFDAGAPDFVDGGWGPLTGVAVVNPLDFGAKGDGVTDDLQALNATVAALGDGGLVYFPAGTTFRKTGLLHVYGAHVKLWAPNRQSEVRGEVAGVRRKQAILCHAVDGCGVFGLRLTSDSVARFDALEDNQLAFDHSTNVEVVGVEVQNSAGTGLFLYGTNGSWVRGNFIHDTWADHIHHTDGARRSWCWANFMNNGPPSNGDDGIACVTYGVNSPKCGQMEWWNNTLLHQGWGRGYSVIGGEDISVHHNWAIGAAGAGLIVASEGSYDSASSQRVRFEANWLDGCAHAIGHPGILVSGLNASAPPLSDLAFVDNVVVNTVSGTAFGEEGAYTNVTNTGLSTDAGSLPREPTLADVTLADTSVLKTRDSFFVPVSGRRGLSRFEVRRGVNGFEQRLEYLVAGSAADVDAFVGPRLVKRFTVSGQVVAVVLSAEPLTVPTTLSAIDFETLRTSAYAEVWAWVDAD